MKKKFDFTAEMKEAQITKSTPQNEYLEEEKRLLGINVKELAELNDNVYGLRADLTALVDLLGKYKLSITQDTQEQAVKFSNTVLGQFIDQIEIKCTEAEQRIAQMDNRIYLSYKAKVENSLSLMCIGRTSLISGLFLLLLTTSTLSALFSNSVPI